MTLEPRNLTIEELVLAYELHQEGVTWKYIAIGLNCDWKILHDRVRNAIKGGVLYDNQCHRAIPLFIVQCATELRNQGFGWTNISNYLGMDREKLRLAVNKENMKKKLQVKSLVTDKWIWVADLRAGYGGYGPITTSCKAKAMPAKTYWFTDSLAQARNLFPNRKFRLAASRDE